ncbi:MAG TPA: ROK family transcriptional regulator [Sphingomonadales bacterium]|nr:ROK family transcriptional regulator [Sphingomonadales bacterium]
MRQFSHGNFAVSPPFFEESDRQICSESERKILSLMLRNPRRTLAEITKLSSFSQQSVSRLAKGLIDRGVLVTEEKVATGKRGQPSIIVKLAPDYAYTIGISLMTDCVTVALMDFSGNILEQRQHILPAMTRRAVKAQLHETCDDLFAIHAIDQKNILGVGVAISGYSLGGRSRYNTPPNLDEWALIDIDEILAEELDLPVWVENDGNAAALGESLIGVGRNYTNFVYLFIAAGIGGGVVINGEMMRGCNGNAGEIGLIVPSDKYHRPMLDLLFDMVQKSGIEVSSITDMLEKFDVDWPAVNEWIEKTEPALSLVVSAIAAILDTEAIVLGGRIPKPLARNIISHLEIYDDGRRAEPRALPRILISDFTGDSGAAGAAMLPFHKYFFNNNDDI